jgi:hypothetical protein
MDQAASDPSEYAQTHKAEYNENENKGQTGSYQLLFEV